MSDCHFDTAALVKGPKYPDCGDTLKYPCRQVTSSPRDPTVRSRVKPQDPAGAAGVVAGKPRSEELTFAFVEASTPKLSRRLRIDWICASVRAALATAGTSIAPPESKPIVAALTKIEFSFALYFITNFLLIISPAKIFSTKYPFAGFSADNQFIDLFIFQSSLNPEVRLLAPGCQPQVARRHKPRNPPPNGGFLFLF